MAARISFEEELKKKENEAKHRKTPQSESESESESESQSQSQSHVLGMKPKRDATDTKLEKMVYPFQSEVVQKLNPYDSKQKLLDMASLEGGGLFEVQQEDDDLKKLGIDLSKSKISLINPDLWEGPPEDDIREKQRKSIVKVPVVIETEEIVEEIIVMREKPTENEQPEKESLVEPTKPSVEEVQERQEQKKQEQEKQAQNEALLKKQLEEFDVQFPIGITPDITTKIAEVKSLDDELFTILSDKDKQDLTKMDNFNFDDYIRTNNKTIPSKKSLFDE